MEIYISLCVHETIAGSDVAVQNADVMEVTIANQFPRAGSDPELQLRDHAFDKRRLPQECTKKPTGTLTTATVQKTEEKAADTSPRMKWNRIEGRFNLKMLLMIALLNACYADSTQSCCKRPMYAYGSGDAKPSECTSEKVKCTEALVYVDQGRGNGPVCLFLLAAEKSSTITLIKTDVNVKFLKEIIHKGPGKFLSIMKKK
ncbi:unnamed protein product [Caenorhabditis auriculariae]|uniref:Uncharacterized protein n=1 Tax=Caenorhabditis auriculariae TaxID=2777116 RepID=A0A8S1HWV1_9PELO|nr:unnamed protein product [Caenorhabditis auriculariae]